MEPRHDRDGWRGLFDHDAVGYAAARPGYPPRVFELLVDRAGLGPGTRVVEIGPGTGQATGPLLDAGAEVVAVELGSALAEVLAATNRGRPLRVRVAPFETIEPAEDDPDLGPGRADLIVSATAFHWLPVDDALDRCARLLRPGGHLALWWNVFGDPDRPDPFHDALQPLLAARAPSLLPAPSPAGRPTPAPALDVERWRAAIDRTGRFGPVHHEVVAWTGRHDPAELRALFASFSPWLALPAAIREPLLDELAALAAGRFDGEVARPYLTPIYLAARR
ncbi:MAG: class I SAM-dependent methyltransferase [Actinomycetota bacterium]